MSKKYIYKYHVKKKDHWRVNVPGHEPRLFELDQLESAQAHRDLLVEQGVESVRKNPTQPKAKAPAKRSKNSIKVGDRVTVTDTFNDCDRTGVVTQLLSQQFTYLEDGAETERFCFYRDTWIFI